jgi:hypothetical protein
MGAADLRFPPQQQQQPNYLPQQQQQQLSYPPQQQQHQQQQSSYPLHQQQQSSYSPQRQQQPYDTSQQQQAGYLPSQQPFVSRVGEWSVPSYSLLCLCVLIVLTTLLWHRLWDNMHTSGVVRNGVLAWNSFHTICNEIGWDRATVTCMLHEQKKKNNDTACTPAGPVAF